MIATGGALSPSKANSSRVIPSTHCQTIPSNHEPWAYLPGRFSTVFCFFAGRGCPSPVGRSSMSRTSAEVIAKGCGLKPGLEIFSHESQNRTRHRCRRPFDVIEEFRSVQAQCGRRGQQRRSARPLSEIHGSPSEGCQLPRRERRLPSPPLKLDPIHKRWREHIDSRHAYYNHCFSPSY